MSFSSALPLSRWVRRSAAISAPLFVIVALPISVQAQDTDSQMWTQFTFNKRYASGLRLFAEVQPRLGDNYSGFTQFIFRPAVGYQVGRNVSLWVGYGWTPNLLPDYNNENRFFEQVLVEDHFSTFDMQNRTRLEQRLIAGAGSTSWRLRHQIRISKPLDAAKRLSAVASNELFWNLNSTPDGPQSGFDQTRPYLGISYSLNKQTRLEMGYLASFVNPPGNRPNRRLDVLMLSANYSL